MLLIVDRIEEGIAVVSDNDNKHINININEIKGNVRDGAVIVKKDNMWIVDEEETINRMAVMRERLNRLFKR